VGGEERVGGGSGSGGSGSGRRREGGEAMAESGELNWVGGGGWWRRVVGIDRRCVSVCVCLSLSLSLSVCVCLCISPSLSLSPIQSFSPHELSVLSVPHSVLTVLT
jgi:hypothetical protein